MSLPVNVVPPAHDMEDDIEKKDSILATTFSTHGVDPKGAQKDKALALLAENKIAFDPNSAEAKRVKRKIDLHLMPLVFFVYCLQLMDKNGLAYANLLGIRKDANLTASEYSWLGSIIYFGYLGGEFVAVFLMQRLPLTKYFSIMAVLWGIVVACHAACHDFASLAAVRFLLGFIEVCTAPVIIYITSTWYTKDEQVTRAAIWYTSSGWANVFGGFISWLFLFSKSFRWQGLYLFYGGATILTGVLCWFYLAATPTEARWLTEEEKTIALERVRANKTGTEVWAFSWPQLKETFLDIRFYMIFLMLVGTGLPNGGITAFGPAIIKQFGFTTAQSTLLNMGSGAATVAGTVIALFVAKKTNRTFAAVYTLVLACVGTLMMMLIPERHFGARYGGYILCLQYPICVLFIIAWITGGFAGTTKKFAVGCAYQIGFAVGNLVGPQTFRAYDAPNYYIAKWTMFASLLMTIILVLGMYALHKIWNKRRDAKDAADIANGIDITEVENIEFLDRTDFNIRSFRYPL